jgi:hypothetical protein
VDSVLLRTCFYRRMLSPPSSQLLVDAPSAGIKEQVHISHLLGTTCQTVSVPIQRRELQVAAPCGRHSVSSCVLTHLPLPQADQKLVTLHRMALPSSLLSLPTLQNVLRALWSVGSPHGEKQCGTHHDARLWMKSVMLFLRSQGALLLILVPRWDVLFPGD